MSDKERVQFDFSVDQVKRIDELAEKTGAKSRAEVMRSALKVAGHFDELNPDDVVEITDKSGKLIFRGSARSLQR